MEKLVVPPHQKEQTNKPSMPSTQRTIKTIAAFNESYRDEHVALEHDTDSEPNPFKLRFFLKRAMAGAGHKSTSAQYREAAETVLSEH